MCCCLVLVVCLFVVVVFCFCFCLFDVVVFVCLFVCCFFGGRGGGAWLSRLLNSSFLLKITMVKIDCLLNPVCCLYHAIEYSLYSF